jgi:uracil-DNA glycosylase family 4
VNAITVPPRIISDYDPRKAGAECDRCPLNGRTVVPPTTRKHPKLIIVGEAPGRLEQNRGAQFVGPAGKLLDTVLGEAKFDRKDAHITSAALCRPDTKDEMKAAIQCCAPRLGRELADIDPEVPILALGADPTKVLLGKAGILKARGFVWKAVDVAKLYGAASRRLVRLAAIPKTSPKTLLQAANSRALLECRNTIAGRVVIPSVHPSFLIQGADGWRPVLAVDVKRAVRWSRKPFRLWDEGPFELIGSSYKARRALSKMSATVTVDIETDGVDPMRCAITCVGVCDVNDVSRIVLLSPWSPALAKVLAACLRRRTVVTHNGPGFDEIALERAGIVYTSKEDTLIATHAFASHLPKSLAHVASIYTDTGPWKQKFKTKGAEEKGIAGFSVSGEDLPEYCAADVRLDALVWKRMQPDLDRERHVYELDMKMAGLCKRMQIAGIRVDDGRRREVSKILKFRAAALLGEMRGLVRKRSFNPARLSDLRAALYHQFNIPLTIAPPTKGGMPSTAAGVLEALSGNGTRAGTLCDLILRWRSAGKTRGTFLEAIDFSGTGRVHPGWKSFGTVTGRLSCRQPNLQNIPRADESVEGQVRSIYVASPGHTLVYFDLSQSEMRAAAYISGDPNFIASCESGDVHTANAKLLFPDAVDLLTNDPKGAGKPYRDLSKNGGFGVLYGAEAETVYAFLLSKGFPVTLGDVETMLAYIRDAYCRYYDFCEERLRFCQKHGHLRTALSGRIRWLGWHPRPTEVMNFSVQSFIADLMNERLLEIEAKLPKPAKLIAQIHDAAIAEVPTPLVSDVKALVVETWKRPVLVKTSGLSMTMPIDLKEGERWSDF